MKGFMNMKIGAKLLTGFILVALIAGVMGIVAINNIRTLDAADTKLYESMTVPLYEMGEISTAFQRVRVNLRDMLISKDSSVHADMLQRIEDRFHEIDTNSATFKSTILSDEMRALWGKYEVALEEYKKQARDVAALADNGQIPEATDAMSETGAAGEASLVLQDIIDEIMVAKVELAKTMVEDNAALADRSATTMIIVLVVVMLLAVGLGVMLSSLISKPLKKALEMIQELGRGHLGMRLQMTSRDEVGLMAQAMDKFADTLQNSMVRSIQMVAAGDMTAVLTPADDKDEIIPAIQTCIKNVKALVADAEMLSVAAVEGRLDTRADATKHGGDFRKIVEGVNNTLNSVIGPLNVAAEYVDRISKGDIPPKITDRYNGDFNEIKNNLNQCIDAVNALVADANMLSVAAVEGRLDTRADATKHGGDFRKIVEGVNSTLNSVIGPLNVAAEYVDRISKGDIPTKITDKYNGDFNEIKNNLNQCIDAVKMLVADAGMLSVAAVEGRLATRADATKHGGDFRKIVEGVNNTLDAVIKPVNEASAVLKEMAAGNLQHRVKGDYKGDHAEIKNALNSTLDSLGDYVTEISTVLSEMANGNMDRQITGEYLGDFTSIKEALNLILESLNQTLGDINTSADQVAAGSRQVSDGSQALSQGATEQASSIEQLTASINDIASQTKKNAMSANEANELAVAASSNAGQGNSQMQEMLKAMEDINTSSANISKIIKVIDEIAFQTNILALNAAVEAARAGQHGKGFAVVAEEVRNLAARSASAAKETTGMIEGSIQKVSAGTRIANDTANALNKIVSDVTKVADIVSSIARASNDQATGITQINQGVEQVSRVIQTNSATAEESAAASEELSSQADLLKDMISRFRLRQHGGSGRFAAVETVRRLPGDSSEDGRRAAKKRAGEGGKPKISLNDKDFGKY